MSCTHPSFGSEVEVDRISRVEQGSVSWFLARVRIACTLCHEPFAFLGLPTGLDLNGAAASIDGSRAALAIAPLPDVEAVADPKLGRVTRRRLR